MVRGWSRILICSDEKASSPGPTGVQVMVENFYSLGVYDLFEETAYKYNIVTSLVGVGSKARD